MPKKKPTLASVGIKDKSERRQIKRQIRSRSGSVPGLAGVGTQAVRRQIKSGVRQKAKTRAAARSQAQAQSQRRRARKIRRVLPQGIRGSRRTGGGR